MVSRSRVDPTPHAPTDLSELLMASPSSVDLTPSITLSDVLYAWPDGTPVFDDLSFSVPRAVYSLVG
ncbi:hypothetical protein GOOTI_146_00010, partial [Gordonia otitidis NBRC 100426]